MSTKPDQAHVWSGVVNEGAILGAVLSSFLATYGQRRLSDLLADDSPVSVDDAACQWMGLPPDAFVRFLEERPARVSAAALLLDDSIFVPGIQRQKATYSLAQMHRLWLTAQVVMGHVPSEGFVVDFGAFPFALEMVLREFVGFSGRLLGTVNRPLREGWDAELDSLSIKCADLDLDPLVRDPNDPSWPSRLALSDESVDVVVLAHVIEHLYHPRLALAEAARILKPGGKLIITTDNAQRLDALLRMLWLNDFIYDPIEQTSAMEIHFWRGHNRFFTGHDLATLTIHAGLHVIATEYHEVFYHAFSDKYFVQAMPCLPRWRAKLLSELPGYRNEVVVVAGKPETAGVARASDRLQSQ